MAELGKDYFLRLERACGPLLHELQVIWDEIGLSSADREQVLYDLENECVEAHRRKLDKASQYRAHLHQSLADAEAELAAICSAMGERPASNRQINQIPSGLQSELNTIVPLLEEMRNRRAERISQFLEVTEQIRKITSEIRSPGCNQSAITFDESALTTRKLEELHRELQTLEKQKSERLKMVMGHLKTLNFLCIVLGLEFEKIVQEVHPSLDEGEESKISDDVVNQLTSAIQRLQEVKIQRMKKLQHLATSILELWDLLDTPMEEQQSFQNITRNVAALEHEMTEPKLLSSDFLKQAEAEVSRLEKLKASKRKEILLKKKFQLDELRRKTHLPPEDNEINFALEALEAGAISYSLLMEQIDNQITLVKEETLNRKDILEKVDKWLNACEEENWLEEYSKDENRYTSGRGVHLSLKRAEKARAMVNKIPAMLHNLSDKVSMWERERGKVFTYDGVSLQSMFEKYNIRKVEKARELEQQREQKKLYKQMVAEQEMRYGSKPSPSKCQSAKKGRTSIASHKRLSLGGAMSEPARPDDLHRKKSTSSAKKTDRLFFSPVAKKGVYCSPPPTRLYSNNSTTPRRPEKLRQPFTQIHHPNKIISAPPKLMSGENLASRTPIMMPVQMQVGPAPSLTPVRYQIEAINAPEVIEYSFEEKRLVCYLAAQT